MKIKYSIYNETYTRIDFQDQVKCGDIVKMCGKIIVKTNIRIPAEVAWPDYIFHGYEKCIYQTGHSCHDCKGKIILKNIKTGFKMGYCATNQRNEGPALVGIRWNQNKLPDELFEI